MGLPCGCLHVLCAQMQGRLSGVQILFTQKGDPDKRKRKHVGKTWALVHQPDPQNWILKSLQNVNFKWPYVVRNPFAKSHSCEIRMPKEIPLLIIMKFSCLLLINPWPFPNHSLGTVLLHHCLNSSSISFSEGPPSKPRPTTSPSKAHSLFQIKLTQVSVHLITAFPL